MLSSTATTRPQAGRWVTALLLLGMFLLIWLPRGLALDRYVTDDEHKWLTRGANFLAALADGDWGATFQREHPGVTVMWAGAAALAAVDPGYAAAAPGPLDWNDDDIVTLLRARGIDPLEQLGRARALVVLALAAALTFAYWAAMRLFGRLPATIGFILIALDPFLVGLGRLLHLDALMSSLLLLALLELAVYLYRGRRWPHLVISAVALGLAALTKSPALVLAPFGVLLFALEMWRTRRGEKQGESSMVNEGDTLPQHPNTPPPHHPNRSLLIACALWGLVAAATFVVLWPAMWVDPVGTLRQVLGESSSYATGGHTTQVFFAGESSKEDPGASFYPVTWLWRTTPVVMVGLGLALAAALAAGRKGWRRRDWPIYAMLPAFVLLYTLLLTLSDKKLDRYLLPVYAPVDLMAGLGWAWGIGLLGYWVTGRWGERWQAVVYSGAVGLLLAVQLWLVFPTHPYYLTYFNPWMGGAARAPEVMMIGRGEGLDQAIDYLRSQVPDVDQLRILSWTNDNLWHLSQATLVSQHSLARNMSAAELPGLLRWLGLDYALMYVHQWQRGQSDEQLEHYFAGVTPEQIISIDGLDYARIYNLRELPPPSYLAGEFRRFVDWDGQVRLVAAQGPWVGLGPNSNVGMSFYLQSTAPITRNLNLAVRLVNADGEELYRADGWPWGRATSNWPLHEVWPDGHTFTTPEAAAPGLYRLELSLYDPETLEPLPARDMLSGAQLAAPIPVAYTRVGDAPAAPVGPALDATLGDQLLLKSAGLPAEPLHAGATLTVPVAWQALAPLDADYTLFVHLLDADGRLVAQHDKQPFDGFLPTRLWKPGDTLVDTFTLPLPAELPAGDYTLFAGAYLPADGSALPVLKDGQAAGTEVPLGTMHVRP
jgi:hypothetical protein